MGCHNCSPSKKDDEARPLSRHKQTSLHLVPQSSQNDFISAEKLYQNTVARDSLDKLFRKILQSYQAKVIPFSNTTLADIPSTHDTSMPSLNNSFKLQHELKLAAEVLPLDTGSSIFLFVNENDSSMLKALITGPAFTPYAHGLFEFDISLQDGMDLPPRVQFNTTGDGSVNFSTYLPATGVIDTSLLNSMSFSTNDTTPGNAASNISNLVLYLQNLLRASGIFGNSKDQANSLAPESPEGMREYKAYCNVIKYATVQYAMIEYLENSPPELMEFVQTYFYIKKDIILKECKKWLAEAQLDNGNYDTIVARYNPEIAQELRNGAYFVRLNMLVMRLEELITGIIMNNDNPLLESLRRKTFKETISVNTL